MQYRPRVEWPGLRPLPSRRPERIFTLRIPRSGPLAPDPGHGRLGSMQLPPEKSEGREGRLAKAAPGDDIRSLTAKVGASGDQVWVWERPGRERRPEGKA